MSQRDTTPPEGAGPAPDPARRRELLARVHPAKARLVVGRQGATEAVIGHVRELIGRDEVIKVRIDSEDRHDADEIARLLAAQVPCHLLKRIGRVAVLYRRKPGKGGGR